MGKVPGREHWQIIGGGEENFVQVPHTGKQSLKALTLEQVNDRQSASDPF
jgi:hypothetical protein